jgi:hypothetical protein
MFVIVAPPIHPMYCLPGIIRNLDNQCWRGQCFLTLVAFKKLNITYSMGIQSTYGTGNTQTPSLVAVACDLAFPFPIIVVMALVGRKEFGQFSSLFRENCTCRSYVAITLILGASLSQQNEVEEFTIVNVFFCIFFALYLIDRPVQGQSFA